jgi:hypothetical protein
MANTRNIYNNWKSMKVWHAKRGMMVVMNKFYIVFMHSLHATYKMNA